MNLPQEQLDYFHEQRARGLSVAKTRKKLIEKFELDPNDFPAYPKVLTYSKSEECNTQVERIVVQLAKQTLGQSAHRVCALIRTSETMLDALVTMNPGEIKNTAAYTKLHGEFRQTLSSIMGEVASGKDVGDTTSPVQKFFAEMSKTQEGKEALLAVVAAKQEADEEVAN
jgi:hypothetical protein